MDRNLVRTDFGLVHMRTTGQAGEEGYLFIHQTPSSSQMWVPLMQLLGERFAVAPDIIGLGLSDPPQRALALPDYARAVRDAAATTGCGRWWIVGHHTGAGVATQLACDFPDEVAGLMVSGYPLYRDWRHRLSRLQLCKDDPIDPDGANLVHWWQSMGAMLDGYDLRRTVFVDKLLAGDQWYFAYIALFTADTEDLLVRARNDNRPSAVVSADADTFVATAERTAALLGASLISVEGNSWLPMARPDVMLDAMAQWRPA